MKQGPEQKIMSTDSFVPVTRLKKSVDNCLKLLLLFFSLTMMHPGPERKNDALRSL